MKSILTPIATRITITAAVSLAAVAGVSSVEAATYNFAWQSTSGNPITNGYSATGQFSFRDSLLGNSNITRDDLSSLKISFFNSANVQIGTYNYSPSSLPSSDEFNFHFNSKNNTIRQSGTFNIPTGVNLGIDPRVDPSPNPAPPYTAPGYNFFTYLESPVVKLYLNQVSLENVTVGNSQFDSDCKPSTPYNPKSCGTTLAEGGELVVNPRNLEIPEPTSPLSLLGLGILAGGLTLLKKWVSWK